MKSNSSMVPEAKEAMNRFKMESASEVGVNLKQGYNGDLTSRQAGSIGGQMEAREAGVTTVLTGPGSANAIGGQMVKKMIESYEKSMK